MNECDHDFPVRQDFCTHLGHETLGAHSRHYVCRKCGALKSIYLSEMTEHIIPASEVMLVLH